MSNPVFYATPEELAPLAAGGTFTLGGAEGRHAATVKRLTPGEPVDLCDGAGLRLVCTVTAAAGDQLGVRVEHVLPTPREPFELVLVQALAKADRDELAIETATELGVDGVVPWQAERSIVRWKMDKAVKGPAKWRNVVATAAKQARRSRIPWVGELVGTAGLVELIASAGLALVLHEDAVDSVPGLVRAWRAARGPDGGPDSGGETGRIVMVVGPEGGMSAAEVRMFIDAGARTALLGTHVLRSSTAGPAAVVLLSQELGRW
ncbi:16S rRNA (uracil(1498)-N(3))-methyltransferase [Arthrobacter sp. A2-55]|uniref:16S rRNA (uracil(1498)-N(3))-methyltransferase n=1 Tax=Arthrobacter sp. A2-55 TaxID=2897337 RepID=UPI0021CD1A99|nr:16S rRNA (uracil(1498)-N(3))-methyltransferase [Arthrobacter sp. A2-55]MCU6478745.1 16S rRNA (uracil(1498)-N(3))-methyltransferase [Arthrobacter sp. A2-55]